MKGWTISGAVLVAEAPTVTSPPLRSLRPSSKGAFFYDFKKDTSEKTQNFRDKQRLSLETRKFENGLKHS